MNRSEPSIELKYILTARFIVFVDTSQQSTAVRCRAVPCGAVGCRAVGCRALPCGAVLCGVLPCYAVLRAVLYLLFRRCQVSFDVVSSSSTEVHHTRFVRTTLLDHFKCSQLSSAQLKLSSALRSAVRYRAVVPCPTVRCCAVLRCALFRTQYQVSCEVPGTGMYVCPRVFAFLH